MGDASRVDYFNEYQLAVKQHRLVVVLFTSQYCQACLGIKPRFERIASQYAHSVKSLILDTETLSKIEGVDRTPTLVVYRDGQEVENITGIGDPADQEEFLDDLFSLFIKTLAFPSPGTAPHLPEPDQPTPHAP